MWAKMGGALAAVAMVLCGGCPSAVPASRPEAGTYFGTLRGDEIYMLDTPTIGLGSGDYTDGGPVALGVTMMIGDEGLFEVQDAIFELGQTRLYCTLVDSVVDEEGQLVRYNSSWYPAIGAQPFVGRSSLYIARESEVAIYVNLRIFGERSEVEGTGSALVDIAGVLTQ